MSSRTCVTALPDMIVFSTLARVSELKPSSRASSWSMAMRISRDGSIQSKLTFSVRGFDATTWASLKAISRT